jgi:hypothetical protein
LVHGFSPLDGWDRRSTAHLIELMNGCFPRDEEYEGGACLSRDFVDIRCLTT